MKKTKTYIVDIDNTICVSGSSDYTKSTPIHERIEKINKLYYEGNMIFYWTARGMASGTDWTDLTRAQLKEWGCKYHELWMNKPQYDVWVDDKADWLF